MISKLSKLFLFFLLLGCKVNKEFSSLNSSKFQAFYSSTIDENEFKTIYGILKNEFPYFPENKERKIKFVEENAKYSLKIYLKKTNFRYVYKSDFGYDRKINIIKSEIERVKNNN